jgi:hypothetical protein
MEGLPMPSITYEEKSLYGTLAAELIVFGVYFSRASNTPADLGRLVAAVALIAAVQIAYEIVLAITSRHRLTDERDRHIRALGYRTSYFALVAGLFAVFAVLWTNGSFRGVFLINLLFGIFLLAEAVKLVTQLVLHRTSL